MAYIVGCLETTERIVRRNVHPLLRGQLVSVVRFAESPMSREHFNKLAAWSVRARRQTTA